MALFLARRLLPKMFPKFPSGARFSSTNNGNSEDDDHRNVQNQLNNLHTYETVEDPNSLVKTTIIRRNPILHRTKTPEEILEDAANAVANKIPEPATRDNTTTTKLSGVSDNGVDDEFEKNVYWGHNGKQSIVGYDIFQELEERLQEILSRNEELNNPPEDKTEETPQENKNNKLAKISTALEGLNRLLSFYLLRSYLYQKHW
ncbi:uncharacterized protein LOC134205508 [Armigeres subalbatus]|uniref:uncharacterized protein LOC134205508 n=1 Tax=Armigeres subalbatus TaxID=124917 RepID=UPI002ED2357E